MVKSDRNAKFSFKVASISIFFYNNTNAPSTILIYDGVKKFIIKSKTTLGLLKKFSSKILIQKYNNFSFITQDFSENETLGLLNFLGIIAKVTPVMKNNKLVFLKIKFNDFTFLFKNTGTLLSTEYLTPHRSHSNFKIKHNWLYNKFLYKNNNLVGLFKCIYRYNTVLKLSIYIYFWYKINFNTVFSASNLALKIFLKNFRDKTSILKKNTQITESFLRKSYFGGFKTILSGYLKNSFAYDVNSQYPNSMLKKMPTGRGKWLYSGGHINIRKNFGFYDVLISKTNFNLTVLPKRLINYTGSPAGNWRGIYLSCELKKILSLGYKVRVFKVLAFKKKYFFRDFVNHFFSIKEQSRNLSLIFFFSKVILVSLYGRFGMRPVREITKIVRSKKELNFFYRRYQITYATVVANNAILIKYKNKPDVELCYKNNINPNKILNAFNKIFLKVDTAVHMSAAITAYSRINALRFVLVKNSNLIFLNIDSFFFQYPLNKKLIIKDIGFLKRVHSNWILRNSFFCGNQMYGYLELWNTKFLNFKNKIKYNTDGSLNLFFLKKLFLHLPFINLDQQSKKNQINFFLKRKRVYNFLGKKNWKQTKSLIINNDASKYEKIKKF